MAKQTIVMLTDDLDGGEAETTVSFAFDGMGYDIDLSGENAQKFRELMGPYLAAGTRKGKVHYAPQAHTAQSASVSSTGRTDKQTLLAIREWAPRNGYSLSTRGRIPTHVQNAYFDGRANPNTRMVEDALPGMPEALRVSREQVEEISKAPAKTTDSRRRGPARIRRTA